jgi:hypothetical protein
MTVINVGDKVRVLKKEYADGKRCVFSNEIEIGGVYTVAEVTTDSVRIQINVGAFGTAGIGKANVELIKDGVGQNPVSGQRYKFSVEGVIDDDGDLEIARGDEYIYAGSTLFNEGTFELIADPLPTTIGSYANDRLGIPVFRTLDGWVGVAGTVLSELDLERLAPFSNVIDAAKSA